MGNLNITNKFSKKFIEEYEIQSEDNIDIYDLVYFIYENWNKITLESKIIKKIPKNVLDILKDFSIPEKDFLNIWNEMNTYIDEGYSMDNYD